MAQAQALYRPYLSIEEIQLVIDSLHLTRESLIERVNLIDSLTTKLELLIWKSSKGLVKESYKTKPDSQDKLLQSLGISDTDLYNELTGRILAGEELTQEERKRGLELELKLYQFDSGTFSL